MVSVIRAVVCYLGGQWDTVHPSPGPFSNKVSQTNPDTLVEVEDHFLFLKKINIYTFCLIISNPCTPISSLSLSYLFHIAVYDHKVCSSLQTVLSALLPGFSLSRQEVLNGFKLVTGYRTGLL